MIPKQLTLQNFLSYRAVTLDFSGLHVACVCGPNGAGKSSLLEAIAWCVWGQSRVSVEDDIIRQGELEAQVSFCFEHDGQTYRVIRTRRRRQTSTLEFQVKTDASFKSITQKGVRATQQYILTQIKIDYDTFVNSAYLRQGRADEFMLKRPSDRKRVLANLLKLDRYDVLAEQAKEQARSYRAQLPPLESMLARLSAQIDAHRETQQNYQQLQAQVAAQQATQQQQQQTLRQLRQQQQQRSQWQQRITLLQQQLHHQTATLRSTQAAHAKAQQQLCEIEAVLAQAEEIRHQYGQLTRLQQAEEQQAEKFQAYQQAQEQRLRLQQQLNEEQKRQQQQLARIKAHLTQLNEQEQEILQTLEKKAEVAHKLAQLRTARKQLRQLDKQETQLLPLRQRLHQIEGQIEQAHTRLVTRIEEVGSRQAQIAAQQTQAPELRRAAVEVSHRIAYLEQRQTYQEALRQKGLERRSFMERLQANQLNHEIELAQFDRTLQQLDDPEAACCPLCQQSLNGSTWQALRDRTQQERDDVQNQIWVIREQLAVCESEIQVLRREYRVLEEELARYAPILEERGQLKAKLASADTMHDRLQEIMAEQARLKRCLQENDYAENLQNERQQIQAQIEAAAYDDRNHALVRSQVDRWRWSELKYTEIKQAERRLSHIQTQRPALEADLQALQTAIAEAIGTPTQAELLTIERQLAGIDYSLSQHNEVRAQLRQAAGWQSQYQTLQQAQQTQAELQADVSRLSESSADQILTVKATVQQLERLQQDLESCPCVAEEMAALEKSIASGRQQRDRQLSQLGRLEQQLSQLETIRQQQRQQQEKQADIQHRHQVYKSLAQAFGRNGIQALMIENLLPQLEAQTNQILSKLSNHQLHIQFVTQRAGRTKEKLIDTFDILIADARGTRPYETYSGGEAFQVNFAIRLAIARLLALQSGTALQMLIVDEGFGTQDKAGCDRLIAAIEAIAPDFACILTITHMPHFREAFRTRIEVVKDDTGSHITISE